MCDNKAAFTLYNPDANLVQHPTMLMEKLAADPSDFFDGRYCAIHLPVRIKAMGYRSVIVHNLHSKSGFNCEGIPEPMHVFSFEIWPEVTTERSLPRRSSRITDTSVEEAKKYVKAIELLPGESIGATSHIRSMCIPPHAGRH